MKFNYSIPIWFHRLPILNIKEYRMICTKKGILKPMKFYYISCMIQKLLLQLLKSERLHPLPLHKGDLKSPIFNTS